MSDHTSEAVELVLHKFGSLITVQPGAGLCSSHHRVFGTSNKRCGNKHILLHLTQKKQTFSDVQENVLASLVLLSFTCSLVFENNLVMSHQMSGFMILTDLGCFFLSEHFDNRPPL